LGLAGERANVPAAVPCDFALRFVLSCGKGKPVGKLEGVEKSFRQTRTQLVAFCRLSIEDKRKVLRVLDGIALPKGGADRLVRDFPENVAPPVQTRVKGASGENGGRTGLRRPESCRARWALLLRAATRSCIFVVESTRFLAQTQKVLARVLTEWLYACVLGGSHAIYLSWSLSSSRASKSKPPSSPILTDCSDLTQRSVRRPCSVSLSNTQSSACCFLNFSARLGEGTNLDNLQSQFH